MDQKVKEYAILSEMGTSQLFVLGLGAVSIGSIFLTILWVLLKGRNDVGYFKRNLVSMFRTNAAFESVPWDDFSLFALAPVKEWLDLRVAILREDGAEVGYYELPWLLLTATVKFDESTFFVRHRSKSSWQVGTRILDKDRNLVATAKAMELGSSHTKIECADGSTFQVVSGSKEKSALWKPNPMHWLNQNGDLFAVTYQVNGRRGSNVFVVALRDRASLIEKAAVFALFTA